MCFSLSCRQKTDDKTNKQNNDENTTKQKSKEISLQKTTDEKGSKDNIEDIALKVSKEGKLLYRSEMVSWYGTDVFLDKYEDKSNNIRGYFSYPEDNDITKCIFYPKSKSSIVMATISFDKTFNVKTAKVDETERNFTDLEKEMYLIREKAINELKTDGMFQEYNGTNLKLIPLIDSTKRVYVMTTTSRDGVVLIGNDYLIKFDSDNNIISKEKFHNTLLTFDYKGEEGGFVMHTHAPDKSEYITATDICTCMLYAKFTNWTRHIVVSENYVSDWNCKTNELKIFPRKEWEKENRKK